MVENHGNSTDSTAESQSSRRRDSSSRTQIVLAESEPIAVASEITAPVESIASAPTIMENEKSDYSGVTQGNVERKPAWNRPSNGDFGIKPVMGASSWPALSETTNAPSNKSSSDSLKSLGDGSASASVPLSQAGFLPALNYLPERFLNQTGASASSNGNVAQPSGQSSSDFPEFPLPYPFPRGQNQRNDFASQSHGGTQRNSYKNQNGNHNSHQSHGGRRNQEHGNQNWNLHRNFNGRGGFVQPPRGTPGFVRPAPAIQPIHTQFMLPPQPIYPYAGPMVFPELAPPPPMFYPHRMPFMEPPPVFFQAQEVPLETRIRNQVHYYFSETNLASDEYLRKRMNDEGFVHIQFIAGFNKLKQLTDNIQLIVDSLQGSNVVELQGYEIRSRHMWKRFLMPVELRIPFIPRPESEMVSKFENLSLEQKGNEMGGSSSSSSSQRADKKKKNNSVGSTLPNSNPR